MKLSPLLEGGGQEGGLRASTENVAGIVGLGQAAAIAKAEMSAEAARLVGIRDHIIDSVTAVVPNAYLVGHRYRRLPGHICFGFSGMEGDAIRLLLELDEQGIAVSSGSACSARPCRRAFSCPGGIGFDPFRARRISAADPRALQHDGRSDAVSQHVAQCDAVAAIDHHFPVTADSASARPR